jgi:alkylation response protein AidB-like acyl-CoA dehydrogenase
MTYPLIVRRDLDFLLHDWLRIESAIVDRETIDAVLDMSETLAVAAFLPHNKDSDRIEPYLDESGVHVLPAIGAALRAYAELGLFAAGFAPELGGLGLPYVVCSASFAYFAAANIATAAYPMLTVANARLIATFGTPAQIEAFARPQIAGDWFGTMCLSEPQAGSSLADVRTRAVADGSDDLGARYRLTGNKMWISGGDQDVSANIVHLVLAKVANIDGALPEGTAGLSLFIVPKLLSDGTRNDVSIAGLNHKMGYRGTANCMLNLGEGDGAIGWIVGAPGEGLRQMFLMMNEARVGVGIGAAALGYRGYRHSVNYARERLQGRAIGKRGGAPLAIIEHPDVKRMLLAQKAYAEGALALCLYCAKLVDQHDDADSVALLGLLTPIAKTWPSEYGLAANDLAIQVHGGYGYTRDFDVEQLWRDNRLNPIHEGTTGIQAIDLLGRKILRDDGRGMAVLRARIADTIAKAGGRTEARALDDAWTRVAASVEGLRAAPAAFDNATLFLSAFGHSVLGWLWLDQALAVEGVSDADFAEGKRRACRYFFDQEMPKVAAWLAPVDALSDAASSATAAIF